MILRRMLLLLVVLGAGCGPSDLDRLCAAGDGVWTLQTVVSEHCSGTSTRSVFTSSYMEDNCRGTFGAMFDAGTATIASDDVLAACRDALRLNDCRPELYKDWLAATEICNDIVVGKTVTGGSCSANEECGGAAYCKRAGSCGLCLGQGGSGAVCGGDIECQSGLCSAGMCVPAGVPANGQCTSDRQCSEGLICRDGGHCQPLEGHIGMACQSDNDCNEYQSSCADGVCTALAKTSEKCTRWVGGDGSEPHCMWFASAGCANGTCQGVPVAVDGGACGVDIGTCDSNLWCSAGRCYPITDEGGLCNVSAECGPYAICVEHACTFSDFNSSCVAP
jgi:hypothetical protein